MGEKNWHEPNEDCCCELAHAQHGDMTSPTHHHFAVLLDKCSKRSKFSVLAAIFQLWQGSAGAPCAPLWIRH